MIDTLSMRERQLMEAACAGKSRTEIAAEWKVNRKTVSTTATRAVEKMMANHFAHACVLYALQKVEGGW
jgi:DNA-binding CsgD family transcriptional regulator